MRWLTRHRRPFREPRERKPTYAEQLATELKREREQHKETHNKLINALEQAVKSAESASRLADENVYWHNVMTSIIGPIKRATEYQIETYPKSQIFQVRPGGLVYYTNTDIETLSRLPKRVASALEACDILEQHVDADALHVIDTFRRHLKGEA